MSQPAPVTPKPLRAVVVEPTNRCNLKCTTCPVNREMRRPRGGMSFRLFQKILDDVPPLKRLSLNNWGEPLLHADIFRMVRLAKAKGTETTIFCTNGTLLDDDRVEKIFESGLDILEFSMDGLGDVYERTRGADYSQLAERIERVLWRRGERGSPLKVGLVFTVWEENEDHAHVFREAWEERVDYIKMQSLLLLGERSAPYCAEFSGKYDGRLVVLWDGTVTICCADVEGEIALGNAEHESLLDIWNGPVLGRLRAAAARGRLPPRCRRCTELDTAVGQKRYS